ISFTDHFSVTRSVESCAAVSPKLELNKIERTSLSFSTSSCTLFIFTPALSSVTFHLQQSCNINPVRRHILRLSSTLASFNSHKVRGIIGIGRLNCCTCQSVIGLGSRLKR